MNIICDLLCGIFDQSAHKSKLIDADLENEAMMNQKIIKMLLLGTSNSGKSTIAKQMLLLHTDGFSDAERMHFRFVIHSNYVDAFPFIAKGIYQLQIEIPLMEQEMVDKFEQSYFGQFRNMNSEELLEEVKTFFNFECVKKTCERISEFYVPDNTAYLLAEANRILQPDYIPNAEGIIHAKASTRGIYEIIFSFRIFTIRLIDVGGQRTERRKWIHCFESNGRKFRIVQNHFSEQIPSKSIVYHIFEQNGLVQTEDPINSFTEILSAFETKITFGMNTEELFDAAIEFIMDLFLPKYSSTRIYTHITNATDTSNIDAVFNATCDMIVAKSLKSSGIS